MKHYQPQPTFVVQPPPAVTKRTLLQDRKLTLEAQIASEHRRARDECRTANVKALSAVLRTVKGQLAALKP